MTAKPISDAELHAYVDGQLDPADSIAVEDYLSAHPDLAARTMGDLRTRNELRLTLKAKTTSSTGAIDAAARRLERDLTPNPWVRSLRPLAAAVLLLGLGWGANDYLAVMPGARTSASIPDYLGIAIQAHRTSLLRATMYSQVETPSFNRQELLSGTAIAVPELPPDWRVTDVQVYPSRFGPSIEMALSAGSLGTVSLFAVRPGVSNVTQVTAKHVDDVSIAYWQNGQVAYSLVGRTSLDPLLGAATSLSAQLH